MLPYRDSKLTFIALVVFFIIAAGYALFEARGQILGPTISISDDVQEVHDPYIIISGTASRISSLSMNGTPIQVTEDGAFSQPYLLAVGDNEIVLDAKDQYGRTREKVIEIMYVPSATSTPSSTPNATTTPQTATSMDSTSSPQAATTSAGN